MVKNHKIQIFFIVLYVIFLLISYLIGYAPGKKIAIHLFSFLSYMLKIFPCAFVLIGLFEVWVKKELIERHLGKNTGFLAYIWIILFAGTVAGGLIVIWEKRPLIFGRDK